MRTTKELREMVNSGPAFGFTGRLVINDILDRLDALAVDAATPHLEPPSHFVETIHLEGVDYVKLEDYMALAKTIVEKADEPVQWCPKTVEEWADLLYYKSQYTAGFHPTMSDRVKEIRAECARVVREFKVQRSPQVELCETCLDRVADVVELLP